jgi:uncharacterized protein (TIGR03437 family)
LTWATFAGGSGGDATYALGVDSTGSAIIGGRTTSRDFPVTTGAIQTKYGGSGGVGQPSDLALGDGFVLKLNPAGTAAVYSTYLGGPGDEMVTSMALDGAGNAYVVGFTLSGNFPVSSDALQPANAGYGGQGGTGLQEDGSGNINTGDAFLTKISPTGALMYSSYFGGRGDDAAFTIALDAAGNPYIGGVTVSSDLKTTGGIVQSSYGGGGGIYPRGDGFITKFDFGGKVVATPATVSLVSGTATSGTAGAALSTPMSVLVVDAAKNPVAGVTVTFSGVNASVNPASAVTDGAGHASTTVTLGSTVGSASVMATVAGLSPVALNLTVSAGVPLPTVTAVANGASFLSTMAPGSWITIFGQNFVGQTSTAAVVPLPTTLGAVQVTVNGAAIPLYVVSATQINAQLPYETALGSAKLVVVAGGVSSAASTLTVSAAAPGIFVFGDNRAVAQNVQKDGSLTLNTATNPIPAGGTIVAYLTGQGPLDNPVATGATAPTTQLSRPTMPYSVKIGGLTAAVGFIGMTPGQIALVQANITVPLALTPGDYAVTVTIGGVPSNGPVISVTTPLP